MNTPAPARPARWASLAGPALLLLTAVIWGAAFLAQKLGADHLGPYAFFASRSALGGLALLAVLAVRCACGVRSQFASQPDYLQRTLVAGFWCGFFLCAASIAQQIGIGYTQPGISAFITTNYVLLVPVFGLFAGRRARWYVWPGVALALAGLYFICMSGPMDTIGRGELFTLLCAALFAVQMLVVDYYAPRTDILAMSCVQFFVGALLCLPFLWMPSEASRMTLENFRAAAPGIAFCGIFSSGVAYTLQNVAQKRTPAAIAALVLSLESVFAVVFGYFIRHDVLTPRQLLGCALAFLAVILTQLLDLRAPRHQG